MADEPTELDKRRRVYAQQAYERAYSYNTDHREEAIDAIDRLFLEWGADAYKAGGRDLAKMINKLVN